MRKYYLDNLRSLTVCLVVVYHVFYIFSAVAEGGVGAFYSVQWADAAEYLLYPWIMVLLFMIAGISARFSLEKRTGKDFLRERTRKLLVPSTIGLFVCGWIQGGINMQCGGAFSQIAPLPGVVKYLIMVVSGTGVLWFIQMLWLFSLLLLLVRKIEKGRLLALGEKAPLWVLLLFGVVFWGAAQILNAPVIAVYRFGIYAVSFFFGYFVLSHDKVQSILQKYAPYLLCAGLVLGTLYTVTHFGKNYAVSPDVCSPLAVAYAYVACLGLLGGAGRWLCRETRLGAFAAKKSWGLYLCHYLPLSVCALLLTRRTSLPPVCIYLITALAAFSGALALYEIFSRIPVLRWCLFGIKGGIKNASRKSDRT